MRLKPILILLTFERLRMPNLYNLRADPFERGPESAAYDWTYFAPRGFVIVPAQAVVAKWLESFKEFPIRQKPASFNFDEVMRKLSENRELMTEYRGSTRAGSREILNW